eukprot:Protomagalhaensia_wolfi_Nauph_80__4484@NODE_459_length_2481_cov_176_594595_g345_i0_p1_GENE_NODE_459_length_2481_cov_176_594595_g345_i0NODE_459_length_2481_cov_176_594595_g345_i0_p1_ORF_typecomplete_len322_score53_20_NODE_459_length_2481_cov_176_594595_g345_i03621327
MLVPFFCLVVLAAILCTVDGKCQPRILIATDAESEEVAVAVIDELQQLKASQQLSFTESAALACVVYSPTTSVELLVPWSGNFHDARKLLEGHRKKRAATSTSTKKKTVATDSHLDVLKEEALLALKFFKGMESDGLVLLLTGSQQDTKLDSAIPEAASVPVVLGYTDNDYLATRDSTAALRFVDLSRNERTKIHVLAQFLLEARCTGDVSLAVSNNKSFQQVADPYQQQSTESIESTSASAPLDEGSHIPAGVAAGSIAVASAGVAGLSVFAGRWFQKRSTDEDEESPAPHTPPPSTFSTPVPSQRLPASPVQHITFSMF